MGSARGRDGKGMISLQVFSVHQLRKPHCNNSAFLLFLSAILSSSLVAGKSLERFTDAQQQPEQCLL